MMRARGLRLARRAGALLAATAAPVAASGCSLGLDRSLLEQDAGLDAAAATSGALADVGPDATVPDALDSSPSGPPRVDASGDAELSDAMDTSRADAGPVSGDAPAPVESSASGLSCARDVDCPQDFTHCHATVCGAGGVCTPTQPYSFVASHFAVGASAFARSSPSRPAYAEAIAAAYPYVFVVTASGVLAFDVTSPITTAPRRVPLTNLPSGIVATVAVGPLVYFVSDINGAPNSAYQAVAWVDVTGASGATSLQARAVPQLAVIPMAPQVPTNVTSLFNVLPASPSGLFLVYFSNNELTYYPTAKTVTPKSNETLVPFWNQALVTGAELSAASGSRLVAYTYDSLQPKLALVTGAGTSAASVSPQTTAPTPSARQTAFASNAAGAVLWASAPETPAVGITAARLTRILADGSATAFEASGAPNTFLDLERYGGAALTTAVVAPPVWLDGTLALGLAADHSNMLDTSVQLVRSGTSLSLASGIVSLPVDPSSVGTAASSGFGYALGARTGEWSVYVLAPSCP